MMSTGKDNNFSTTVKQNEWKLKRAQTLVSYLGQQFLVGLEYTIIQATLLHYLTIDMQSTHPIAHYGMVSSGRFVTSMFVTIAVSTWFDKKRRLKLATMSLSVAVGLGYALYMIPTSPYLAFVGCMLQGCNFAINALMNSEIIRVYEENEVQQMILLYMVAYGAGEIAGPVCVYFSQNVRFQVGPLQITQGNFPGLIMLVLTFAKIPLAYLFVHDVSLEQSLIIGDIQNGVKDGSEDVSQSAKPEKAMQRNIFQKLYIKVDEIYGRDGLLLILQQFYSAFAISAICRLPPIILSGLGYGNTATELCFVGISLLTIIFSIIIWKFKLSSIGVYFCGVISMVATLLAWLLLLVLVNLKLVPWLCNLLLVIYVVLDVVLWVSDSTFFVPTIGKLCYGPKQSFVEGTRMGAQILVVELDLLPQDFCLTISIGYVLFCLGWFVFFC